MSTSATNCPVLDRIVTSHSHRLDKHLVDNPRVSKLAVNGSRFDFLETHLNNNPRLSISHHKRRGVTEPEGLGCRNMAVSVTVHVLLRNGKDLNPPVAACACHRGIRGGLPCMLNVAAVYRKPLACGALCRQGCSSSNHY